MTREQAEAVVDAVGDVFNVDTGTMSEAIFEAAVARAQEAAGQVEAQATRDEKGGA